MYIESDILSKEVLLITTTLHSEINSK